MGRIDDALQSLEATEDGTERALQLAGLISTLFKIKGVSLVVVGQLAYDSYADTASEYPEIELAVFAGDFAPRVVLEIMRGQLYGQGSLYRWLVAGIPIRFQHDTAIANRELCREFTTGLGVVKLMPVEEIAANYILASVHPNLDEIAHGRAHQLLMSGLADVFQMDWPALHALCHRPEYRVGEELARMRLAAKKEVDVLGMARDHVGETGPLPSITAAPEATTPAAAAAPIVESEAPATAAPSEAAEPAPEPVVAAEPAAEAEPSR